MKVFQATDGHGIILGDCLDVLKNYPDDSVDLVFTSPPFEDARTYGIGFDLKGQEWVDWCVERFTECYRICRGLVAWNVQGKTRKFQWSATPALMAADLHRRGVKLRNPPIFHRVGIPGSGGPDWLRSDYEWIICASKGKLPWSDNTACGHPPKWAPGGAMSHRQSDGDRVNRLSYAEKVEMGEKVHTKSDPDQKRRQAYLPPKMANPGNVFHDPDFIAVDPSNESDVVRVVVGGGLMGSNLSHENEAPFPEKLADFFIKSFCPPGGIVLDPFGGSGTVLASAVTHGRIAHCIDVRESQYELMNRRYAEAKERKQ